MLFRAGLWYTRRLMVDDEDFAALFEQSGGAKAGGRKLSPGDVVQATVVQIGRHAVFLDVGTRSEGEIDRHQLEDEQGRLTVKVGDRLRLTVAKGGDKPTLVTRFGAAGGVADLELALESGAPVSGTVTKAVKGGLEVSIGKTRAFCPASQVHISYTPDISIYEGQTLDFKVIEVRDNGRSVVVSRKALLQEQRAVAGRELLANLSEGAIVEGTVQTIQPYGAFVDLGGAEGLIHISELGHGRVEQVGDVVSVGETVRVDVSAPWQEGSVLLLLDRGGIKRIWPLELKQGAAAVDVEIEDTWIPGASFHVVAVKPGDNNKVLPDVRRDSTSLSIGNETRTLAVAVEVPQEAQTGQTIPITVRARDRQDRPVTGHVSVWAVDEAVLALSPMRMPDFVATFVVGFAAHIDLGHGYGALLLPFVPRPDPYTPTPFDMNWTDGESLGLGNLGLIGHGAGGGGYGSGYGSGMGSKSSRGPAMPAARSNFSSAPIFIGDAELGKDGVARLEGTLPDNLTTFRLTAVVSAPLPGQSPSKSKSKTAKTVEGRFGSGDARVRVTKPLV
ncbi:MAG: S1 RNA-binding domain-containing protein, partial [Myxococcales bacterium]|nr:S1 RNA-binding domain-containing protein [Myxococcales bacterium]